VKLIDAGIGPRTTAQRMVGTGLSVGEIQAICLTHLDSDHFKMSWLRTILNRGIRVFCHERRRADLMDGIAASAPVEWGSSELHGLRRQISTFDGEAFEPLEGVRAKAIALAHDQSGSHGFVFDGFACRLGYATDLGCVPDELLERFCDLDMLALESNYDPQMQLASGRPWYLKQRIMGGRGHLSNAQALAAVLAILDRCESRGRRLPRHIVLLHRSRECNCPKLVRKLFGGDARIGARLTLAEQFQRTTWLRVGAETPLVGEQLSLAWG
jgi:phosphoribosyl 1,2-cyclic phosphodiesterase